MEATVISEGTMEQEEAVYPCKGCGDVLEEGKAFELANNRWHIDCFRCNSCRTLLDTDANLLLLGDGSLICNNCTYSCTVCKDKIEDLAILTGEQAFCAKCFKCRNCKRKIENLKYAKTSQGIFCMQCHESLMARRRKKSRQQPAINTRSSSAQSAQSGITLDKSLPALPPHIIPNSTFSPESEPLRESFDTAAEQFTKGDASPRTAEGDKENILLTPRTFGDTGPFAATAIQSNLDDELEVPLSLDPSPQLAPKQRPGFPNKDYFGMPQPSTSASDFRNKFGDLISSSRDVSQERTKPRSRASPHIAYQEKGRQPSSDTLEPMRRRNESGSNTPASGNSSVVTGTERFRFSPTREIGDPMQEGRFKLQEAPKRRSSGHIANQTKSPLTDTSSDYSPTFVPERARSPELGVPKRKTSLKRSPLASPSMTQSHFERPARDDSMKQATKQAPSRKEVVSEPEPPSSILSPPDQTAVGTQERASNKPFAKSAVTNLSVSSVDGVPARSPRRPLSNQAPPSKERDGDTKETFTAPREAPPVPAGSRHKPGESVSSIQSETFESSRGRDSPGLPPSGTREQFTGDFPREDDDGDVPGILRKMSKAVRHGRSHSDKIGSPSPKWSARNSRGTSVDIKATDISSPIATSESSNVDIRNKLRYSQQRIADLETEKLALQEKVNGTENIRQLETDLKMKRSTVTMLDVQRETVIRELEVMTEQLQKAKNSDKPLDITKFKADVMQDFVHSMEALKTSTFKEIEALMARKNELTAEISNLIQMKDKGFQEYDSLSSKNQQLVEHNNQLVQNIQEIYRLGKQPGTPGYGSHPAMDGLGIYSQHAKGPSAENLEIQRNVDGGSQVSDTAEIEQAQVLQAPKVVDLRKGGGQKKFINWKKGRDTVAKNVSKGFKGAFGSEKPGTVREDGPLEIGIPYNSSVQGEAPRQGDMPLQSNQASKVPPGMQTQAGTIEQGRGAWLRRNDGTSSKAGSVASSATLRPSESSASTSTGHTIQPPVALPAETSLFGSDLSARCEFERSVVPSLVMSCISEVSSRGLDQEGIYRKSGSSTQVKAIQAGFESGEGYDISDVDLDIHAVTGCLKQYLRRLPNPLITFERYDDLLDCVRDEVSEGKTVDTQARAKRIREVILALPKSHRDTLEFLCFHLTKIMELQQVNLMTPLNIAVVFAPTIMRPLSIEREITDTLFQRNAVQTLLEHYSLVFDDQ